jgi:hypothetical protein
MKIDDVLHLNGIDILPAPINHIFLSADHMKEPVMVDPPQVAGQKPSIPENLPGFLRIIVIAVCDVGPLDGYFSDGASLCFMHMFIYDPGLTTEARVTDRGWLFRAFLINAANIKLP